MTISHIDAENVAEDLINNVIEKWEKRNKMHLPEGQWTLVMDHYTMDMASVVEDVYAAIERMQVEQRRDR